MRGGSARAKLCGIAGSAALSRLVRCIGVDAVIVAVWLMAAALPAI
jgi:hypothetical protein